MADHGHDPLIYDQDHVRLRAALIASGLWVGQPCPICSEPMWPGQKLVLAHEDDENGRSIPGRYKGLAHDTCNAHDAGKVNPWGVRTKAAEAVAARSPERQREIDDKAARDLRKQERAEFDAVKAQIAANEVVPVEDTTGRDW